MLTFAPKEAFSLFHSTTSSSSQRFVDNTQTSKHLPSILVSAFGLLLPDLLLLKMREIVSILSPAARFSRVKYAYPSLCGLPILAA